MDDYKAMYLALFNAVTDATEILKKAQIQCEQMFIEHGGLADEDDE